MRGQDACTANQPRKGTRAQTSKTARETQSRTAPYRPPCSTMLHGRRRTSEGTAGLPSGSSGWEMHVCGSGDAGRERQQHVRACVQRRTEERREKGRNRCRQANELINGWQSGCVRLDVSVGAGAYGKGFQHRGKKYTLVSHLQASILASSVTLMMDGKSYRNRQSLKPSHANGMCQTSRKVMKKARHDNRDRHRRRHLQEDFTARHSPRHE